MLAVALTILFGLLLIYALIIVAVNMLFSLIFGKLFHFNLEEIILASNANIGGPTTAAGMAISQAGRDSLARLCWSACSAMSSATTPVPLSALSSVHNKRSIAASYNDSLRVPLTGGTPVDYYLEGNYVF